MIDKQLIILYALQNKICINQKQIYSSARSVSESAEHYMQSKSKKKDLIKMHYIYKNIGKH